MRKFRPGKVFGEKDSNHTVDNRAETFFRGGNMNSWMISLISFSRPELILTNKKYKQGGGGFLSAEIGPCQSHIES